MYLAVYSPDRDLIAVFKLDDDQLVPSQRQAHDAYRHEYTSEFCSTHEFASLNEIPEFLP